MNGRSIRSPWLMLACVPLLLGANTQPGGVPASPAIQCQVTPISPELGLFDVTALGLPGDQPPRVLVRTTPGGPERSFAMFRRPQGESPQWTCRVLLGADNLPSKPATIRVEYQTSTGSATTPPTALNLDLPALERVPAWALGATWYQVFPERFRNGDTTNDPRGPSVATVPWTSDYSDVTIEEIELAWSRQRAGDPRSRANFNSRGGSRRATIYSRRYGGDLIGVHDAADHIAALGVTALYLCPIFESSSLHKYDAADFLHVDRTFGPTPPSPPPPAPDRGWTAADRYLIDTLLPDFRSRGIRVVLDGVWNHTGTDFWAFRDIAANGRESAYSEWYTARFDDSGGLRSWQGWDGVNGNLPEFRQTDAGDLTPPVGTHIFEVTTRWMDPDADGDPSDGIDGWRLDVAPEIGLAFWERWRAHVRSLNPQSVLIGEIWFDARPWFGGRAFDAQMNYPFATAVVEWCAGAQRTDSTRLAERLGRVFSHAPQNDLAQMNLLGSHDTTRLLTMLSRPDADYDDGATSTDLGRPSLTNPPSADTLARAELAVAIQALWLGSPMIFAGDELGVFGPDDPDNRKPVPWPDAGPMQNPGDDANLGLLGAYQRWFTLRSRAALMDVLRYGTVYPIDTGDPDVFAFCRALNDDRVLLVANRGHTAFDAARLLTPSMDGSRDARVNGLSARYFAWKAHP